MRGEIPSEASRQGRRGAPRGSYPGIAPRGRPRRTASLRKLDTRHRLRRDRYPDIADIGPVQYWCRSLWARGPTAERPGPPRTPREWPPRYLGRSKRGSVSGQSRLTGRRRAGAVRRSRSRPRARRGRRARGIGGPPSSGAANGSAHESQTCLPHSRAPVRAAQNRIRSSPVRTPVRMSTANRWAPRDAAPNKRLRSSDPVPERCRSLRASRHQRPGPPALADTEPSQPAYGRPGR